MKDGSASPVKPKARMSTVDMDKKVKSKNTRLKKMMADQ